jgi:hypothetical protein
MTFTSNDTKLRRNLSRMLAELAADEHAHQHSEHLRRGRPARSFRYAPSGFHVDACRVLGYGDSHDVAATIHSYELRDYLGARAAA